VSKRCTWKPCERPRFGISTYCADHTEEARRNVLRALGLYARESLMWQDGDEEWLMPVGSESAEVERRKLFTKRSK
jgi:hypothetical protein